MVTQENPQTPADVVDGQQRLATAMILLGALRDYFQSVGDSQRVTGIEGPFLIEKDFATQSPLPKLTLNEIDRDYFTKRVLENPDNATRQSAMGSKLVKESHKLINDAAEFCAKSVKRLVDSCKGDKDKIVALLTKWREFLINGARVIWVTVKDESNAYVMFETLNDRGIELSKADLIKNFLLSKSKTRVKEVLNRWVSMQGSLETGREEEDLLVTYIRHYWSSVHGPTRERELYANIKRDIKESVDKAFDLANQLSEDALP